jgi:HSP20 family molecular chaperone IbpA
MPGAKPADVDVKFERGDLSLYGKVAPRPAELRAAEYGIGDFYRTFAIAPEIDSDKIAAEFSDGVPDRPPAETGESEGEADRG